MNFTPWWNKAHPCFPRGLVLLPGPGLGSLPLLKRVFGSRGRVDVSDLQVVGHVLPEAWERKGKGGFYGSTVLQVVDNSSE